jgi:Signal transduction histidine kinase
MKRTTIKWRIFKYNLIVIILLIALTTIVFNFAIKIYMESDNKRQLDIIANRTEDTALRKGPDFFPKKGDRPEPPPLKPDNNSTSNTVTDNSVGSNAESNNELYGFYFMLNRSLREPLSVLNADFILLDSNKEIINPVQDEFSSISEGLLGKIKAQLVNSNTEKYMRFNYSGIEYMAIVKKVADKNNFGLSYIIIYSSLAKIYQLQLVIIIILLAILLVSAIITSILSSLSAKKISEPFSALNDHIGSIAERNFGTKISLPVDDELQEFVTNINVMSEKLESYDKAQKTFLQNASHEFRTPLMSIQSYAEGIKYKVVENDTAADIIIDETKRMTHLVEDLLYLSRLDSIEENYRFSNNNYNEIINSCVDRMNVIATKNNILIIMELPNENVTVFADEDKLSRAITNIISNCIRYAKSTVSVISKLSTDRQIELYITDDGPGFDKDELPSIFERFYKGKKGNFGLGLAIAKSIVEKHNGSILAKNMENGAMFIIELPK